MTLCFIPAMEFHRRDIAAMGAFAWGKRALCRAIRRKARYPPALFLAFLSDFTVPS
jgi:hypothetical protein